jgi:archaellum component FlaC
MRSFVQHHTGGCERLLQDGFQGIQDRFVQVDDRFAQIDQRFATIDKRFETIDGRLDSLDEKLKDVTKVVDRIDRRTQNQVDAIYERTSDHGRRIRLIEEKLGIDPKLKTIEIGS